MRKRSTLVRVDPAFLAELSRLRLVTGANTNVEASRTVAVILRQKNNSFIGIITGKKGKR